MASIPLLSDQDVEQGELPTYEDAVNRNTSSASTATKSDSSPRQKRLGGLFSKHFDDVQDANSVAFAHVSIRLGFLRKVLGILAFQFVVTVVFCTALYMTPGVKGFLQQQPWIVLSSLFGSLVLLFAMFVHAHTVPLNYFLLGGWTLLQAITVGSVVTFYDVEIVIQAVLLTAVVVVGLFFYTLQSKRDFQKHYAVITSLSLIFLVAMAMQMILMSPMVNFLMSVLGAALFSIYLVFDIDMIMHHYSEEDYIIACISIYMDIMGLFLRILEILNELNRN